MVQVDDVNLYSKHLNFVVTWIIKTFFGCFHCSQLFNSHYSKLSQVWGLMYLLARNLQSSHWDVVITTSESWAIREKFSYDRKARYKYIYSDSIAEETMEKPVTKMVNTYKKKGTWMKCGRGSSISTSKTSESVLSMWPFCCCIFNERLDTMPWLKYNWRWGYEGINGQKEYIIKLAYYIWQKKDWENKQLAIWKKKAREK